ncbi:hypothetical protein ACMFMG_003619 [Clarireedia jacksonii]
MASIITRQSVQGAPLVTHVLPGKGAVTDLKVTEQYIALALDDTKIYVFNSNGTHRNTLQEDYIKSTWTMAICKDTLVSGEIDGDIRVWDLVTGEHKSVLSGHAGTVRCIKFIDEENVVSSSRDGTLRIWNIDTAVCRHTLEGHHGTVRCLDVGSQVIVSGGNDTDCKVWNTAGECLRTLSGHGGIIYALAMNENGQIATESADHTVCIWNAESGSCVAVLEGHTSLVGRIEFHGKTLISGGADGHVRLWSLETMELLHDLAAHQGAVTSLQALDDCLITGGSDGCVKLWDFQTGQLIRQVGVSGTAVWKVAFGAGGKIITTVAREETLLEVYEFS